MQQDDQLPTEANRPEAKSKDVAALPAQLGPKLRALFADVELRPVPDRLAELLETLAAKEKEV